MTERATPSLRAMIEGFEDKAAEGSDAMVIAYAALLHALTQAEDAELVDKQEEASPLQIPVSTQVPRPVFQRFQRQRLADGAMRSIVAAIRNGDLLDQEKVNESRLAETLGASRTVAREALQRLEEGTGLIIHRPGRSPQVSTRNLPRTRAQRQHPQ